MAEVTGSAQDSGVETEGDQESNDSAMSNLSAGAQQPQQPEPMENDSFQMPGPSVSSAANGLDSAMSKPATPESTASSVSAVAAPPPSVTEDGYLGDCSSDGGNEKNFPMPLDTLERLSSITKCSCHSPEEISPPNSSTEIELPSETLVRNLQQDSHLGYPQAGFGVFVNYHPDRVGARGTSAGPSSRKMRSSLKSRFIQHHSGSWSHLKANMLEKKLRTAASTNNTDSLAKLLEHSGVNVNAYDEHHRTALHFGASKGYADIVRLLLQHGADPNCKDVLGNTALHLAACTNHIEVVTLLLRAGTDVTTLDNNGRTPMQLAQSKLKLLQKNSHGNEMSKVKTEVAQVVEMIREYLSKTCHGTSMYNDLLNSFSQRLTLHQTHHDIHSDLQNLLDSLGNLTLRKET